MVNDDRKKVTRCPKCGQVLNVLDFEEFYCRWCDKYFMNGREIVYSLNGLPVYAEYYDLKTDLEGGLLEGRVKPVKTRTEKINGITYEITVDNRVLRQARELLGIDRNQMAIKLGCSDATISNYEQGKTIPNKKVRERYSKILGIEEWEMVYVLSETV